VLYRPSATSEWRFPWDIPVEDFLFGFALVTLVLVRWNLCVVERVDHERLGGAGVRGRLVDRLDGRLVEAPAAAVGADAPSVTVIVPARDEAGRIGPLLAEVASAGVEVIVVDDGSTDDTPALAASAGATVVAANAHRRDGQVPGHVGPAQRPHAATCSSSSMPTPATPPRSGNIAGGPLHQVAWSPCSRVIKPAAGTTLLGTTEPRRGDGRRHRARAAQFRWRGPAAFAWRWRSRAAPTSMSAPLRPAVGRDRRSGARGHCPRSGRAGRGVVPGAQTSPCGCTPKASASWCGDGRKTSFAGARSIPILRTLAVTLWIATLAQPARDAHIARRPVT
jgi:hypothetical protein